MRVYLDNCIIGLLKDIAASKLPNLVGHPRLAQDTNALWPLLGELGTRGYKVFASDDSGAEIEALRKLGLGQKADELLKILFTFELLPVRHMVYANGGWHADANVYAGTDKPHRQDLLVQEITSLLRSLGNNSVMDARHLAVAIDNYCDIFLTVDYRTLHRHRGQITAANGIKVLRPTELLAQLRQP